MMIEEWICKRSGRAMCKRCVSLVMSWRDLLRFGAYLISNPVS
jgi:hypothetical protein